MKDSKLSCAWSCKSHYVLESLNDNFIQRYWYNMAIG